VVSYGRGESKAIFQVVQPVGGGGCCRQQIRIVIFRAPGRLIVMNISKKEMVLVAFVLVLGGVYLCCFTDWFKAKHIRIEYTVRSSREAWSGNRRFDPGDKAGGDVTFTLHGDYRLTSVQVVPLTEFKTNRYAHPLWHLVSKSGSSRVDGFAYGAAIAGMTPEVATAEPESLEPGVQYRLLIEAGSLKGTNDFSIPARSVSRR
jgi:hypothetical protein